MVGKRKKRKKKKRSRFSFLDKYSLSVSFLVFAGFLVTEQLPELNPFIYLIVAPVFVRLLFDVLTQKTVGSRIIRTLHPQVVLVDVAVFTVGITGLYMMGYWTLHDIAFIINIFNAILEPVGYHINLAENGTANITGL